MQGAKRSVGKQNEHSATELAHEHTAARAAKWAAAAAVVSAVGTMMSAAVLLGPQRDAAEAQAAVDRIDVDERSPAVVIDFLTTDPAELELYRSGDEASRARFGDPSVVKNDIWELAVQFMSDDTSDQTSICRSYVPDSAFEVGSASYEWLSTSINSDPCGGGLASISFLRIEAAGTGILAQLSIDGTSKSRGWYVVPRPGAACDGGLEWPPPVLDSEVANIAAPEEEPLTIPVSSLRPGDVVLVPVRIQFVDAIVAGPELSLESVSIFDQNGALIGQQHVREEGRLSAEPLEAALSGNAYEQGC